jgi:hypothetical protein
MARQLEAFLQDEEEVKFEKGDCMYSEFACMSGGKSEMEMMGVMGVNSHGVWWLVAFYEVLEILCMGIISGGSKFCAFFAQDCSVRSHDRAKAEALSRHLYLVAGEEKFRGKPTLCWTGWYLLASLGLEGLSWNNWCLIVWSSSISLR